jgi:hypothetical protein
VIGIYLCSWMALQVTQNVIGFYLTFYLQRADMFPIVLLAVQGSAMVFLFIWSAVSRRIGKQAVYYSGMTFWILVMAGLFSCSPTRSTSPSPWPPWPASASPPPTWCPGACSPT